MGEPEESGAALENKCCVAWLAVLFYTLTPPFSLFFVHKERLFFSVLQRQFGYHKNVHRVLPFSSAPPGDEQRGEVITPPIVRAPPSIKHWGLCQE